MVTKPKSVMSKLCDEVGGILGASSKIPYIQQNIQGGKLSRLE